MQKLGKMESLNSSKIQRELKDRTEWREKDTILKWMKKEFKKDKSLRKFKFMQYFQSKLLAIIRQIIIIN